MGLPSRGLEPRSPCDLQPHHTVPQSHLHRNQMQFSAGECSLADQQQLQLLKAAMETGLLQRHAAQEQEPLSEVSQHWMQRMVQELAKHQRPQMSQVDPRMSQDVRRGVMSVPPPPGLGFEAEPPPPRRAVTPERLVNPWQQQQQQQPQVASPKFFDFLDEGSDSHDDVASSTSAQSDARLDQLIQALSARSSKTTLMIRNVPVLYTREMLLAEWSNDGTYDFLYLPYSCSMQRNLSYAFINFTNEAAALAFVQRWQKKRLSYYTSRKPLNISFADVQGRDSNLWQLKKKRVKRIKINQCQPMIFEGGQRVPLLDALKALEERAMALPLFGEVVSL